MGCEKASLILPNTLLAFLLFCFVQDLQAEGYNLLANGGFDGFKSNGIAEEWRDNSDWADLKIVYSAEKTAAHSKLAQKIDCLRFNSGAVQFIQTGLEVSKGKIYEVSIWMKGSVASPVEILLRQQGSPYRAYFSKSFRVGDAWRKYKFTGVSVSNDSNAYFMVRFTGRGTLWLDDATYAEAKVAEPTLPAIPGNLISNGSFEIGLDRWGGNIREVGGYEFGMQVAMHSQRPVVDYAKSRVGRASLKISVPKYGRVLITSPYVKVNPGRKYSLSLWSTSNNSRNLRIGLGAGGWGQGISVNRSVSVGKGWQKYTFSSVLPPVDENAWYIFLESQGEGTVWIDGVQLNEGETADFTSHAPAEIGLKRAGKTRLYEVGAKALLSASISSDRGGVFSASIKSINFDGKISPIWSGEISLVKDGLHEIKFSHPTRIPGYYRLVAEINKAGKLLDRSELSIGIVNKRKTGSSVNSPFGGHARFNPESLNEMKLLGVDWLRMHPPLGTKWFLVEKNRGEYSFYDEPILLAKSMGFNILGSLDTTPRWASTAPADMQGEDANGFRSYPPKKLADWENYVYQTVSHYKGIIDYWEVWNEPSSNGFLKVEGPFGESRRPIVYTELLKAAYRAAKRANPGAVVVAGVGTGQRPTEWVGKIFGQGAYDYMDVLSFHLYTDGRPGDVLDTPTGVYIDGLRSLMRSYGRGATKPVWESESGILASGTGYKNILQVVSGYSEPVKDSAAYMVRNFVHLLASGASKWFYYSMFSSNRIDRNEAMGFYEWDGSPKPMAVAYANLAGMIGDTKYVRSLDLDKTVAGEEFVGSDRVVNVVWARDWSTQGIRLDLPVSPSYVSAIAYDLMGKVLGRAAPGEAIDMLVTKVPSFIVFFK